MKLTVNVKNAVQHISKATKDEQSRLLEAIKDLRENNLKRNKE